MMLEANGTEPMIWADFEESAKGWVFIPGKRKPLTLEVRGAEPACRRSVPLDRRVGHHNESRVSFGFDVLRETVKSHREPSGAR